MVYRAAGWNSAAGAWLRKILERRPARLATVALANKMARIAWAVMTREDVYRPKGAITTVAALRHEVNWKNGRHRALARLFRQ